MGAIDSVYWAALGSQAPASPSGTTAEGTVFEYYAKYFAWKASRGADDPKGQVPCGASAFLWDGESHSWKVTHILGDAPKGLEDSDEMVAILVPYPAPAGYRMVPGRNLIRMKAQVGLYHDFVHKAAYFAKFYESLMRDRTDSQRSRLRDRAQSSEKTGKYVAHVAKLAAGISDVFENARGTIKAPSIQQAPADRPPDTGSWFPPSVRQAAEGGLFL